MRKLVRIGFIALSLSSTALLVACGGSSSSSSGGQTRTARFAAMNGAQEVPAVTTSAVGTGILDVDESTGAISGFIVTQGLVGGTVAHIHPGAAGTNGSPIVTLNGGPEIWVVPDDATLTPAQIEEFRNGRLYFNAHTSTNPNGEIRGQIDRAGTVRLASMNAAQEAPAPVLSGVSPAGAGVLAVNETTGQATGFIITTGLTGPANVAHIHGPSGRAPATASPIVTLVGGPNVWMVPANATLTGEQRAAFAAGNLYFNSHTTVNPTGEVRGQIDKSGTLKFASLNAAQETPSPTLPVGANPVGAGILAVNDADGQASGFIVTTGLSGNATVAHVHGSAARGAIASPIVTLVGGPNLWVVPDSATLNADQRSAFSAGTLYYNSHTPANANGEVRGQIE